MKRILCVFLFATILMLPGFALADQPNVYDEAGLFSGQQASILQSQIDIFVNGYNADLVVLTIDDAQGKESRAIADDFYDDAGFGEDGALLLINMDARDTFISTSGSMIDILNDDRIEAILDLQMDYLQNGQYFEAMGASIDQIGKYAEIGPVAGQYRQDENQVGRVNALSGIWIAVSVLLGLAVAFVVCLIIFLRYKKDYKPVAYDYKSMSKLDLNASEDQLIDSHTTSRYVPPPPPSSGGGGGGRSTTHSSSSGRSHGGGGRNF